MKTLVESIPAPIRADSLQGAVCAAESYLLCHSSHRDMYRVLAVQELAVHTLKVLQAAVLSHTSGYFCIRGTTCVS
jgi:hypothetical protein